MNKENIEISLKELKLVFQLILNKIEFEIDDPIKINKDLYRYIDSSNWDLYEKEVIATGSLFDDILNLKKNCKRSQKTLYLC
jgi:hypothetical protein